MSNRMPTSKTELLILPQNLSPTAFLISESRHSILPVAWAKNPGASLTPLSLSSCTSESPADPLSSTFKVYPDSTTAATTLEQATTTSFKEYCWSLLANISSFILVSLWSIINLVTVNWVTSPCHSTAPVTSCLIQIKKQSSDNDLIPLTTLVLTAHISLLMYEHFRMLLPQGLGTYHSCYSFPSSFIFFPSVIFLVRPSLTTQFRL